MIGTFINVGTVVAGASIGLLVGKRIPDRIHETVFKGLGLLTLVIGVKMSLETQNVLVLMASTMLGGLVGEWVGVHRRQDLLGGYFQTRFGQGRGRFSEAFVTSSLVFCVGR